jgi:hypothetical protein
MGALAAVATAFVMAGTANGSPLEDIDEGIMEQRASALNEERLIATCMKDRGFDYIAVLPNDLFVAEAYTAAQKAGKQGDELKAAVAEVSSRLAADPNEALVAALPAARQKAWDDALSGTDLQEGCSEPTMAMTAQDLAQLETNTVKAELAQTRAAADPVVKAAEGGYVSCMGSRGYSVTNTEQIAELVEQQAGAVIAANLWPADVPEVLSESATARQRVVHAATTARIEAAEEKADSITAQGNAAHEACIDPYNDAFDAAQQRMMGS